MPKRVFPERQRIVYVYDFNSPYATQQQDANENNEEQNESSEDEKKIDANDYLLHGILYHPGISSLNNQPYYQPQASSITTSVANGRRLLVKGNALEPPPQDYVEDVTKTLGKSEILIVRETKDIAPELIGFRVVSIYEVLNEVNTRICLLGLMDNYWSEYTLKVVNPYGEDDYNFKQWLFEPVVIRGPGITSPLKMVPGHRDVINVYNETNWFKMLQGSYNLFSSSSTGFEYGITYGVDPTEIIATADRDWRAVIGGSRILRIDFKEIVCPEQRVVIFAACLHMYANKVIRRAGRPYWLGGSFKQVLFWLIIISVTWYIVDTVLHW